MPVAKAHERRMGGDLMLFEHVRNQATGAADRRLLMGAVILFATWLTLCIWCIHALSGLPAALTTKKAASPPIDAPISYARGGSRRGGAIMHKSQLSTFVIDCQSDDLDGAAAFWAAALGRPVQAPDQAEDDRYRTLAGRAEEPLLLVQRVEHASRVHLDIETDDIEAEVERLERLGAKRVEKIRTWWVLEAPTGQRFCVVRPQRGALGEHASTWPDGA
jgi:hypothetical protein